MIALACFTFGMMASGFFSGTETGYYRIPRIRIVLDSIDKHLYAKIWLWFINRPAIFVSTVLIGNNIANYIVSAGIAGIAVLIFGQGNDTLEVLIPVLSTPFIFVYGEFLPKLIFFYAPSRLLKFSTGPFLVVATLLMPATLLLYLASWIVQQMTGTTPLRIRSELERKELHQMISESSEAGVLLGIQQSVSQNLLVNGDAPISQFCMPLKGFRAVSSNAPLGEIEAAFAKTSQSIVAIVHPKTQGLVGYIKPIDAMLVRGQKPKIRPVLTVPHNTPLLSVLSQLISLRLELAHVVDSHGKSIGVVSAKRLWALSIRTS